MKKTKNDGLYRDIPKISGFLMYGAASTFLLGPLLLLFLILAYRYIPSLGVIEGWVIIVLTLAGIAFLTHRGQAKIGGRIMGGIILFVALSAVIVLYYQHVLNTGIN